MSEYSMFETAEGKVKTLCGEKKLDYRINTDSYPITMVITPQSGLEGQMSMLEKAEEKGYISSDASLVFTFQDGVIGYRTYAQFEILDDLFSKLKSQFKILAHSWTAYYFREVSQIKTVHRPKLDKEKGGE